MRTDQHTVSTGLIGRFDDQAVQIGQDILEIFLIPAQIGRDVGNDIILAQIVFDHFGNIGIDDFIIGHPGSGCVDHGDAPGFVHLEEAGYAEQGIGIKYLGIKKVVVNATIQNIDSLKPFGRPHLDRPIDNHQIPSLDQFLAHLLGQKGVFIVGRVIDAWGQHRHVGRPDIIGAEVQEEIV